ncbi:PREDICTED: kinesin-like protein KIN-12F [Camelina sativa]|uniref:Kinesin-like protein KIN-12F n=1 Tax=Camelina sativa TaxID=90675 RepID=A0ABM0UYN0_CAMSA|nr:PREDICTED: kinesin-like protein KIN-12F [Camelina sativa]
MKSPAILSENRFLGSITSSSIRNLLPKSISAKHKPPPIHNPETKIPRSNDENSIPVDPNQQAVDQFTKDAETLANLEELIEDKKMGQSNFAEDNQSLVNSPLKVEARTVLSRRTNPVPSEITEEDDDPLGGQIRELKDELIRTKSDGYKPDASKSGHFARDSLSQLRVSINKSALMSSPRKDESEGQEMNVDGDDVLELNKHIDKFHGSFDSSVHSSFASASGYNEPGSMSEEDDDDDVFSDDLEMSKHGNHKDADFAVHDNPSQLDNVGFDAAGSGISIRSKLPTCILEEPIFSESPKFKNVQKSVAASTKFSASPRNVSESSNIGNMKANQVSPSMSKKLSGPTDSLAASLQRGLQIIDYHQGSSLSKSSSVSFSFGHMALKPCAEADNLNASVQSFRKDKAPQGGLSSILLCRSCNKKVEKEAEVTEAGSNEKHLKNMCMEQAAKIEELTRLLRKSGDGEDGVEVIKETYETKQVSEEFRKANFDVSEKEALLKEIADLKSKLQPTKSTDNVRSSLLLRSIQMRKSMDVTKIGENSDVLEKEREMWTEMESEWISLTDDLRMDIDNHRSRAENLEIELKQEKLVTEELNDALTRAMLGHSRFIEQYTELQEKYNELGEKHCVMIAGITDVKKAASKAAMNGRHGKRFAKAFSDELSAIRAEKEKERELLKKENKSLRSQVQDTAEAVQAAGELLVRLRESEQALQVSEERYSVVEEEKERLKKQMEQLKSRHKTEIGTMKQYLAESKLPGSALLQPWYKDEEENEIEEVSEEHQTKAVSFDDYDDDQAWRAEFGATYQDHHY